METADALVGRITGRMSRRGGGALSARANAAQVERVASAVVGGTLLTLGLRSRSLGGAAMALASGALLFRGLRGRPLRQRGPGIIARGLRGQREAEALGVERSITIGKSAEELQRLWREPGSLSRIMGHFAEVSAAGEDRMRWKVRGPLGRSLEWDSRIVEERPGELLRWESVGAAELPTRGSVRFRKAPGDWGTEVTLHIDFKPPGGALGQAVMKRMRGGPNLLVQRALRRFKSLAETGEIPTVEHTPSARRGAETD